MNNDLIKLGSFYKAGYAKNCNTCTKLERIPHDKIHGFLKGICKGTPNIPTDYFGTPVVRVEIGQLITFHPNDWLLLPCHDQRPLIIKWKDI